MVRANSFSDILKSELSKIKRSSLITNSVSRVPRARQIKGRKKKSSEMRAQLVNIKSGCIEQDLTAENWHNSIHMPNVVPPRWTSTISLVDGWRLITFLLFSKLPVYLQQFKICVKLLNSLTLQTARLSMLN